MRPIKISHLDNCFKYVPKDRLAKFHGGFAEGQVGIYIPNADPTLVDQNTVSGASNYPYIGNTGAVKTDHNAGF